jgi:hypothetical protein
MADFLWTANAAPTEWAPQTKYSIGFPTAGDAVTSTPPTHIGGDWFLGMYEEFRTVIIAAGLDFDPTDPGQLLKAIQEILTPTFELREDGSFELREDGSFELRV